MITFLKRLVSTLVVKLLNTFGWSLIKKEELSQFKSNAPLVDDFLFMLNYPSNLAPMFLEYRNKSSSQRKQDLFVLTELGYKKNGYFVEFGACDGLLLSNSLLLEKEVDVYFFDGPHSQEDHYNAVTVLSSLKFSSILYIVDDWNWDDVRQGTLRGLDSLGIRIAGKIEIFTSSKTMGRQSRWHNGYAFFVLER
jgi:hypothetical protein